MCLETTDAQRAVRIGHGSEFDVMMSCSIATRSTEVDVVLMLEKPSRSLHKEALAVRIIYT